MFLEQMKTTDFELGKKYIFVIPMGATEQHGPFLPLGTDSYIQDAITKQTEVAFPEVIFAPALRITCSQEHEGFAGSMWITQATMELMLRDMCMSLAPYARTIVLASWHGGNISLLERFVAAHERAFGEVQLYHATFDSDAVIAATSNRIGGEVDEHAGNTEISMMLACEPSLSVVPDSGYPKKEIRNAWDSNRVSDVSKDGIVDNHPKWVVDRKTGEWCIAAAAGELKDFLGGIV